MATTPLVPFSSPFIFLAQWGIGSGNILEIFLLLVFAFWALYTLIAVYHWLKYSHASLVAFPAIFTHLVVSVALMSYALTGNPIP